MIYKINDKVAFVKGAKNGAIYDFITQKVYSVNDAGCSIIKQFIENGLKIGDDDYLKLLERKNIISNSFVPSIYRSSKLFAIKLSMAWIEVTQKCNLKCIHCYEGNNHVRDNNAIALIDWQNIINQLSDEKIDRLIVIGGEPCCNNDINEILLYAAKYPIDITLFTNATLLDDALLNTIIDNKIKVKVSVYGPNSEIHDSITTIKGSFNKLVSNVKKMKENGVDVTSSIVIMKENELFVDQTIEFVKSIGMRFKKIDVIRNVYGGTQNEHTPTVQKVLDYAYFKKPNFVTSEEQFENNLMQNTCWYGKIAIMENGDVIPCEFERNYKYGNIHENTIREILLKEETISKWRLNLDNIEVCKDCEYRYACKDCRALGISVSGSMTSKNPRCLYNPYIGEWAKNNNY